MERLRAWATTLTVVVFLIVGGSAGYAQQAPDRDTTRQELRTFDQFLDNHPEIAKDLKQNPSLINNEDFQEKHPELRDFLGDHPRLREELKENPRAFMNREGGLERSEGAENPRPDHDTTRGELASFDQFLDGHPQINKDLRKNPGLINNREFLENHPQLRDYLEDHPKVREELKENPRAFMSREKGSEKHEGADNRKKHPKKEMARDRDDRR
jgi:hypothetical protein